MKKQILTIAILAALPFGAWADTLTITNDDKQHIASTAYVKGAYNDAMNAVDGKQNKFMINLGTDPETGDPIGLDIAGAIGDLGNGAPGHFAGNVWVYPSDYLISAQAVNAAMRAQRVKIYTTWDGNGTKDVEIEQPGLIGPVTQ